MSELTPRQTKLLDAIIQEYIEIAEPVGSQAIFEKYNLGVSPATLRNEMAVLTQAGFLEKPHVSAGRIPTPLAFRYYLKSSMQEQEIPVVNEVALKQRLWNERGSLSQMLSEAVRALADETHNLSLAVTDQGETYSAGAAHVLRHPEFYDIDLTRTVLFLLDEVDRAAGLFERVSPEQEWGVILGEECGLESLAPCGVVYGRLDLPGGRVGYLSVLGPMRLEYARIVPMVKYMRGLISELSRNW